MLRKLLTMTSRVGRPSTVLDVGDSGGRILYLAARLHPVSVVVPLERDQVRQLVAVCSSWLAEQDAPYRLSPATVARLNTASVQV